MISPADFQFLSIATINMFKFINVACQHQFPLTHKFDRTEIFALAFKLCPKYFHINGNVEM